MLNPGVVPYGFFLVTQIEISAFNAGLKFIETGQKIIDAGHLLCSVGLMMSRMTPRVGWLENGQKYIINQ